MSIVGSACEDADRVAAVVGRDDHHARAPPARWTGRRCCACRRRRSAPSCRRSTLVGLVQVLEHLPLGLRQLGDVCGAGRTSPGRAAARREWARRTVHVSAELLPVRRPRVAGRRRRRSPAAGRRRRRPLPRRRTSSGRRLRGQRVRRRRRRSRRAARGAFAGGGRRRPRPSPARPSRVQRTRRCAARRAGSGSTTSRLLRAAPDEVVQRGRAGRRALSAALNRLGDEAPARPSASARSRASSVEMTQTGMCRVARSFLSRSSTRQPSMSGRKMSSVIAVGLVLARQRQARPRPSDVTSPLKPFSRAASSRKRAKPRSFSTISSTRSPGADVVAVVAGLVDRSCGDLGSGFASSPRRRSPAVDRAGGGSGAQARRFGHGRNAGAGSARCRDCLRGRAAACRSAAGTA